MFKIGLGQDSHRIKLKTNKEKIKNNKNLVLGGIKISSDFYAVADSDGDIIIHSVGNALSTAIGGGSLNTLAGPMFKKGVTDSKKFLKVILDKVNKKGFKINNIAIMLEGQRPKLEKHRSKIQQSLARLLNTNKKNIGLAFTTGQDLTIFGKGQGIQVITTVLLVKK